jgi:CDP-diacylglycerol--serine O-phosphatidyltransferase
MKQIPNLFTLLNLVCGCLAIIFAMQSGLIPAIDTDTGRPLLDNEGGQFIVLSEKIWLASIFIFVAAVIDFLDGFVARLFKATSEMGKQLDSLADVVSFGVAPSIIVYQFLRMSIAQQEGGLDASIIWLLPAFIIPCAGAYRLARFNIDTEQSVVFKGLPIPAAGILIASFPLIYWFSYEFWIAAILLETWFWYVIIVLLSWLMVSKIPMLSLKFNDFTFKNNIPKILLGVIALVSVALFNWASIPVIIAVYILLSLLFKNKK